MSDSKEKADKGTKRTRATAASKSGGSGGGGGSTKGASAIGGTGIQSGDDVIYQMTRAIQILAKQREGFTKAVEQFNEIEKDIEMRVNVNKKKMDDQEAMRNKEMVELEAEFDRQRKRRRIDLEQDLREFGAENVKRLLGEQGKVSINAEELAQLREDLAVLRQGKEEGVRKAGAEANDKARAEIAARTETLQLKHSAELAAVNARADQQVNQIKVLQDTINSLRNELDRQRELTREVAYAQQPRAPPALAPTPPYRGGGGGGGGGSG
jgi:hypothetical protein